MNAECSLSALLSTMQRVQAVLLSAASKLVAFCLAMGDIIGIYHAESGKESMCAGTVCFVSVASCPITSPYLISLAACMYTLVH